MADEGNLFGPFEKAYEEGWVVYCDMGVGRGTSDSLNNVAIEKGEVIFLFRRRPSSVYIVS